ncbi:MAG TPA: PAS domain S-box protein [Syntrophomonadaceae bacterium]|nr:PAS domain S-box protein [Syntrophomonadaceae bacterium]
MIESDDYMVFLECIDSPVLVVDEELGIVYCNAAYARLIGRPADELEGLKLLDVMPELIGSNSHRAYLEVLSTGSGRTTETEIAHRYFTERIYPAPQGLISIADETTDSHRFERAVQALAHTYHDVFDEIWDAVIIQDTYTTEILEANKSACNMFGYAREQMIKMDMGELCADEPPFTSEEFKRWLRMAPQDRPQSMEWKARDINGHEFWIDVRCRRLMVEEELRLVAVIRDISTVKTANDELRHSREAYEGFFKNASDFIFIHDMGGNFVSVNPAAERITGYLSGELARMNIQELADEDSLQLLRGFQYQRLANGRFINYELTVLTKGGHQVFMDVSIWPIYKAGKPVAVQGIARNVTRLKKELTQLKTSEQNLAGLIEYLPDATLAIDLEGKVVAWNQAMEELTGIKAQDMMGKGNYEYALAFYDNRRPIMVDLVLKPEEVQQFYSVVEVDKYVVISEFATPNLRGRGRHLWGRAMPWYDQDGRLLGAIESLRDITERHSYNLSIKDRMENMAEKADFVTAALNSLDIPATAVDKDGKIIFSSERFNKSLGYKSDELSGKPFSQLLIEKDQTFLSGISPDAVEPAECDLTFLRRKGTEVPARVEIRPLTPGAERAGFLIIIKKQGKARKPIQE